MSLDLETRIGATAARQHGVVTREQLVELGMSRAAVDRRLMAGRLRRLHRGVYLVGPIMPPHAREMAAVLAAGSGAVVSHLSAASLWGLRAPGSTSVGARLGDGDEEPVDITIPGANRGRRPGIRLRRVVRLDPDEQTVHEAVPITTPRRTLVDLADVVGTRELEAAVARAEREALVTRDALSALLARHHGRPGTRALRAVLEANGGPVLTRSEAEEKFLALIRKAGLPVPETNVSVGPYELDFLWRSAGLAVEVDGFRYHSSRPSFERDRRKDAWLLGNGIHVVRLSWRQLTHEAIATAVQVGQALARASS